MCETDNVAKHPLPRTFSERRRDGPGGVMAGPSHLTVEALFGRRQYRRERLAFGYYCAIHSGEDLRSLRRKRASR
jgi:hypothetical protein